MFNYINNLYKYISRSMTVSLYDAFEWY